MLFMDGHYFSKAFRRTYPSFNLLIWSYHWFQIRLYEALLSEAAENRLLVNFHGSNKPTGRSRTWPNELTREAVRGMEARSLGA